MNRSVPLLVLTLTLAACATPMWQKAGATGAEAQRDSVDCRRQAEASTAPSASPASQPWPANPWLAPGQLPPTAQSTQAALDKDSLLRYADQRRFEECMQAKGYRLRTR